MKRAKKQKKVKKNLKKLLFHKLYDAARDLSASCGDNYGSEASDEGYFSMHYSERAKEKLDVVLRECGEEMEKES